MQLFADQDLAPQFVGEKNVLVQSEIGLPSEAWRESRLSLGKHFENVWLGFMSETPRWSLSGEALWKASLRRSPCGTVRHKNISAHADQPCCRNEVSTGSQLGHKTFTLRHTVFKSAG